MKYQVQSYGSPKREYKREVQNFWTGDPVIVQEKIDGSQFSFLKKDGELYFRSHGQQINPEAAGMFANAVDYLQSIKDKIEESLIFRAEYLKAKRQNKLSYATDPAEFGYLVLFDIEQLDSAGNKVRYCSQNNIEFYAGVMGLMPVQKLDTITERPTDEQVNKWLSEESQLGGAIREGVVMKNYALTVHDHAAMIKFVRGEFSENVKKGSKDTTLEGKLSAIALSHCPAARLDKAMQHLIESGEWTNSDKDIGLMFREIAQDLAREEKDAMIAEAEKLIWKFMTKQATAQIPAWYNKMQRDSIKISE